MRERATPALRWLRALLLAGVALGLGVVAHLSAGGLLPGPLGLGLLLAVTTISCAALLGRAASTLRITGLVVAGQAFIHAGLTAGAGHAGDPVRPGATRALPGETPGWDRDGSLFELYAREAQTRGGAGEQVVVPDWVQHLLDDLTGPHAVMAVAHVAAAVLVGLWLASGERALWALLRLSRAALVVTLRHAFARLAAVVAAAPSRPAYPADAAPARRLCSPPESNPRLGHRRSAVRAPCRRRCRTSAPTRRRTPSTTLEESTPMHATPVRRTSPPRLRAAAAALVGLALAGAVSACSIDDVVVVGGGSKQTSATRVAVDDAWVKASPSGMTAAFVRMSNDGSTSVRLTSVTADAADSVELHETVSDGSGGMTMRPKEGGITIPAGHDHELAPGGDHIMLMGLRGPLTPGERVVLVLHFSDSSTRTVRALVKDFTGAEENYTGTGSMSGMGSGSDDAS